jgi:hypothetical protein
MGDRYAENKYLSVGSTGQDEAVAQEEAQNSVKKGVHFGTHRSRVSVHASYETLTLAHPGSPCSRGASV